MVNFYLLCQQSATRFHHFCALLTTLMALMVFLSCSRQPDLPLRIGTNVWLGYEPLYLARERGFLDEKDVQLVEYPSASEVIRAFRNQAIDGAALTLDEVLLLAQDGLDPRVVLVTDISHGGDVILGRSGMQGPASLQGQRVGVENNALGAYVLSRALAKNGLEPADVQIVSVDVNEHEAAFLNARVDAVVTFDPVRSRLLASGAVKLFDSTQIPGEIVDVLVMRADVINEQQESIRYLLKGWFQSLDFLEAEVDAAAGVMAMRQQITTPEVLKALKGIQFPTLEKNRTLIGGNPAGLTQVGRQLTEVMLSHRLLLQPVDPTALFEPNPLETIWR